MQVIAQIRNAFPTKFGLPRQSGLAPELNPQQLLSFIPRIAEVCEVECLQLYSLDSTNIRPQHWLGMMQTTWERIDPDWMHVHHAAAERIAAAKQWYETK